MKRKIEFSPARWAMKLLCTLLGLVFAVMLCGTLAFQHLLGKLNYVEPVQPEGDGIVSAFSAINLGNFGADTQDNKVQSASGVLNILLVGQDRREGESQARSDSMILCTFNKHTKQLTMTSFLRDLYVSIPGYHDNRINAAYSEGGISLLRETLEQNFGVEIDGTVEVDFTQFSGIVDLLGGVEIELRQDEANVINQETGGALEAGVRTLNGMEALAYSRIRKLDAAGDFSRTNRQRKVMSALFTSLKDIKITAVIPLLNELLPMITTDMNSGQLLLCALEVFPMLSGTQIVSQHIPANGTYTDQTIDGMAVLVADMDAARQLLENTMQGN